MEYPSKSGGGAQEHLGNSGVIIEQSDNSGGNYENKITVDYSHKNAGTFITAHEVFNYISYTSEKGGVASTSSIVGKQKPPPSSPRSDIGGWSITTVTMETYNIATDGRRKSVKWDLSEQVEFSTENWHRILTTIEFRKDELSPNTYYGAYLIFKTTPDSKGLGIVIRASADLKEKAVCLRPTERDVKRFRDIRKDIGVPVQRSDGWMELELGQFFCEDNTRYKEVMVSLRDPNNKNEKTGLIIERIAIVPVLLAARKLYIKHSDNDENWTWCDPPKESRFTSEVAELLEVDFLYIEARIRLSASTFTQDETVYAAYLIFRTWKSTGLEVEMEALVSTDERSNILSKRTVCLYPYCVGLEYGSLGLPMERPDGLMELELGRFFFGNRTRDQELLVTLKDPDETKLKPKTGFLVAGIELRRPSN